MPSIKFNHQKSLHQAIKAIETARLSLYPLIEDSKFPNVSPVNGGKAEWNRKSRVLKFHFADVLSPVFHRYEDTSDHWLGMMAHSFFENECAKNNEEIYFENAFLLIVINFPTHAIWDVDSKSIKPIINGIRYLRIVPDDNWKNLTYMIAGRLEQGRPSTEMYITDWSNMVNLIDKLGVSNWHKRLQKGVETIG